MHVHLDTHYQLRPLPLTLTLNISVSRSHANLYLDQLWENYWRLLFQLHMHICLDEHYTLWPCVFDLDHFQFQGQMQNLCLGPLRIHYWLLFQTSHAYTRWWALFIAILAFDLDLQHFSFKVTCEFVFRSIVGKQLTITLSNFTCTYSLMSTIHCEPSLTLTISSFKVKCKFAFRSIKDTLLISLSLAYTRR